MKKCKNCGKLVFACCGKEPDDYCNKCDDKNRNGEESENNG